MAAGTQAQGRDQPSRRRGVRYRVQAPLDVIVLRSGIPQTLPGRSVNLGEGGVSAVLAGELLPGEAVGVEIRLPRVADPLRTRALVRHHDELRSGLQFIGLSVERQAVIAPGRPKRMRKDSREYTGRFRSRRRKGEGGWGAAYPQGARTRMDPPGGGDRNLIGRFGGAGIAGGKI